MSQQTSPQKPNNDFLEQLISTEKRKAISKDAGWLFAALGIISFLGSQFVLNQESVKKLLELTKKPGQISLENLITAMNIFLMAAPLILVLAFIYVYATRRMEKGEGFGMGHIIIAVLLLYGAGVIGNTLGFAPVRSTALLGSTPPAMLAFVLDNYFNSYGFILFFSSLAVAWFFGQAWKILTSD